MLVSKTTLHYSKFYIQKTNCKHTYNVINEFDKLITMIKKIESILNFITQLNLGQIWLLKISMGISNKIVELCMLDLVQSTLVIVRCSGSRHRTEYP